ncbi:Os07g0434401 [Oryza sativa Japonica Group]|uniref:Os07g0434401 protein n=2 Tax=Oryza sativa subsp. japonica TaxID=39947 RepID=Q6Z3W2_ORYSJ|nr:hypothetical protein [Oryza sativa Japonica Group]BAT01231.1 Os07g0434401 [Oryza sativa Japonica Group]
MDHPHMPFSLSPLFWAPPVGAAEMTSTASILAMGAALHAALLLRRRRLGDSSARPRITCHCGTLLTGGGSSDRPPPLWIRCCNPLLFCVIHLFFTFPDAMSKWIGVRFLR